MCAGCRSGRVKYLGFKAYWGRLNSNPWKRRGEGDPRPAIWLRLWQIDFLFDPFHSWKGIKIEKTPWGKYRRFGPLEVSYISRD
jgi:hypothetical protein